MVLAAMQPIPYRIERFKRETHDTFTIELKPVNGNPQPAFAPGQFNMLYVFGTGEIPISISGDPACPETIKHTTRVVGTVTRAMHALKPGDRIGVRGPFGSNWPTDKAEGKDVVIVAGGIGLAPLRPALFDLLANRKEYRRIVLLYGTRTPEDILFKRDLRRWRSHFDLEVHITVDRSMEAWRGNVGVVTTLIPRAPFDPSNAIAFICGPEVMMWYTVEALQQRGVKSEDIFVSMERNMKCATGFCGRCQYGPNFICKDGPVFRYDRVEPIFRKAEV
ncbi:MAG: FAD/NAD(P)-binding protein [Deltaproteobacteria bacterium]|nr:FAD/NAD(P)-binding protein [Deltaproteobacteria bacterium]MBW2153458.1 FAD/NAD(P)-binding protein [Deltaproteobacteria bacterium]